MSLTEDLISEKSKLREKAKNILVSLKKDKDLMALKIHNALHRLTTLKEYKTAKTILAYYPLADEIDLTQLYIDDKSKIWVLPRPIGKGHMLLFEMGELKDLQADKYCVKAPPSTNRLVGKNELDLCLVPGLMFDKSGYRLGRGGGYYDRLLAELKCKTVGICFEELLVDKLPKAEHDISVDLVIKA